jgi:hypothetical protein
VAVAPANHVFSRRLMLLAEAFDRGKRLVKLEDNKKEPLKSGPD